MPGQSKYTPTLQQVYESIENDAKLSPGKRTELRSAIKRFCEISNAPASTTPADGPAIRAAMKSASWQLAGLSKGSWANLLSRVNLALEIAGVDIDRRRQYRMSAEWAALIDGCGADARSGLTRFAGWCTVEGIAPEQVNAGVFDGFLDYLARFSTVANPRERWHVARRAWNEHIAKPGSVFPPIPNNESEGWRGLPLSAFPETLGTEIERWRAEMVSCDPFAVVESKSALKTGRTRKAVKKITADNYISCLRQSASRLIAAGTPITAFASLSVFVDVDTVKTALRAILGNRPFDEARPSMHALMTATLNLAGYLKVDFEPLEELKALAAKVRHQPIGMCDQNKARLQPFRDKATLRRLARLPLEIAKRIGDVATPTVRNAQLMQMAVLLELLLHIPMRVKNAAALSLDKHFQLPAGGKAGRWRLNIPKGEVKNDKAIDAEFSVETSQFFERYYSDFRPVLCPNQSSEFFVSQGGKKKGANALSKQFSKFIRRELGLTVNIHLMRHLMAFAYLEARPGDYEGARQLLGHKQITTTINFYAGAESAAAFKRLDRLVDGIRDGAGRSKVSKPETVGFEGMS